MQIEIFNLPHCYLLWPRISTFNGLVFFVWDSQLLVWSDLLQVELQLFSLYPPLQVQGPWRRTQWLHLFVGDDGDDVGDDDGDLQIHQVYGFCQFSFGPLLLHMSTSKAATESNREKSKRSPEELRWSNDSGHENLGWRGRFDPIRRSDPMMEIRCGQLGWKEKALVWWGMGSCEEDWQKSTYLFSVINIGHSL